MNYWLVKSEPEAYSWTRLVADGQAAWTGVRSYPARLHLRGMRLGDRVLYYHSVTEKQIVGLARVTREAYPDPTAPEDDWSAVDLVPVKALSRPVALALIKGDAGLKDILLVRQSRLSVTPLTGPQFQRLLVLAETKV